MTERGDLLHEPRTQRVVGGGGKGGGRIGRRGRIVRRVRLPLGHDVELLLLVVQSAPPPLHLAARCAWQRGGPHQHHGIRRHIVVGGHACAYLIDDALVIAAHQFAW